MHSTLNAAIKKNDLQSLNSLIKEGADVNKKVDIFHKIPLILAASCCHSECVKALIDAGADVNGATEHSGDTPLSAAISKAGEKNVKFLLEAGADPNKLNPLGQLPLVKAVTNRNPELVDILVKAGADVNGHLEDPGDTPLIAANFSDNEECIRRLLAAGADPNKANPSGQRPLMRSLIIGNPDLIDILVKAGADVDGDPEHPLLSAAVSNGNEECIRRLLANGADPNKANTSNQLPLMRAAINGNPDIVDILVEAGADVNGNPEDPSTTPLIETVSNGNNEYEECVRHLLANGADPNISNSADQTALMPAVMNGYFNCVDILVQAEADVNLKDRWGRTALLCCLIAAGEVRGANTAESRNFQKCITSLITARADVNMGDNKRYTPLMAAAEGGCSDYLVMLTNAGAEVNRADWLGTTALSKAVVTRNWDCVELLKKAGADVKMEEALEIQVADGNCDGLMNLLAAGADVNSPKIKISLVLAALEGRLECVELLMKKGADMKVDDSLLYILPLFCHLVGAPYNISKSAETDVMANVQSVKQERVRVLKMLLCHILVKACRGGCCAFVDALIRSNAGADVNESDILSGDTPLIAAARSGSIRCMKSVLRAGADVIISDRHGYNALEVLIETFQTKNCSQAKNCILLLVTAGEMVSQSRYNELRRSLLPDGGDIEKNRKTFEDLKLDLHHICGETIRNHFLNLDRHYNLFDRIHRLPLPSILKKYLLFYVSLEPGDDNLNNMDDETAMAMMIMLKSNQILRR